MGNCGCALRPAPGETRGPGCRDLPPGLADYLRRAEERQSRGDAVVPCELRGRCAEFHGNSFGSTQGFCCERHKLDWQATGMDRVRAVGGDVEHHWDAIDADFVSQFCSLADAKLPSYDRMRPIVEAETEKHAAQYRELVHSLDEDELRVLDRFKEEGELWPMGCSAEELRLKCRQPEDAMSLLETYSVGLSRFESLYRFSQALAQVSRTPHDVLYSVKRTLRILKKTLQDHPSELRANDFRHVLDVYRTGIVLESLEQIQHVLEVLREFGPGSSNRASTAQRLRLNPGAEYVVERIKNRFAKPSSSGYMDCVVNVRIDGYTAEVQLHLKKVLDFKGEAGRKAAKWAQLYLEGVDRYEGERSEEGRRHGRGAQFFASGERYAGSFMDDKRHGFGSYFHSNGARYDGDYAEDQMHGKGAYFFASGEHYVGDFFQDTMHGKGAYFFEDGSKYDGDYVQGRRHGRGTLVFASGDRYEGDFLNDEMHGKGTYFCSDRRAEVGAYVKGQDRGPGVRWSSDRKRAWKLEDGESSGVISLEEAKQLAEALGFPDGPPAPGA